ncbi:glycosyltransferase [Globicatella sulfidifaciens]|uniref:Glycosyltransferase involved in cell wall bisynthesis n=1 Tax=Globicatella sulfidifaciens DSM 15739 TaxID=1121925 RepID=A0A1T4NR70_9LACT|nr:glycosyltransferase [Globicatella sulfidifaciens]SJZ81723.1 Glycosyltransferase involved in cell wall bisynthesis [Globicatella sulfidifaciens DSM 15739]
MRKVNFFIGTLSTGGAERVVSNLSLNLNKDIKKIILMFGEKSKIDYPYEGELIYLDKDSHSNILSKLKVVLSRIITVQKIKRLDSHATTISFLEYPNLINTLTSRSGRSIVSVRNHMSTKHNNGFKSKLWNSTIKYLYPKADLIIAVSEEIKRDLIDNYNVNADKIKVIYNSYDLQGIREMAKEEIEDKYSGIFNHPVIITVGRLNKQKGHWHLIRAFSKVKEAIPNAKLVILGEGDLESYLNKLASDLNIIDDVHFLGFQKNPFKYIVRSKVFAMSSFHEGFPNALAEAMACGVPVISSDCKSGPREILAPTEFDNENIDYQIDKKRYGILTPVCDGSKYNSKDAISIEELKIADSILSLLKDEKLWNHFSNQSQERIKDFEISKIIKEWESVI